MKTCQVYSVKCIILRNVEKCLKRQYYVFNWNSRYTYFNIKKILTSDDLFESCDIYLTERLDLSESPFEVFNFF